MNISKPTLILNKDICRNNIRKMVSKARINNVIFRPHFKTHQSAEIGEWFRQEGVNQICVSSVTMAEYFAKVGWKDITIAFPVNTSEIDKIDTLSSSVKLNLLIENIEGLNAITCHADVFIKIDAGYHRTGVDSNETETIRDLVRKISEKQNTRFAGFLSHFGNTYHAKTVDEIEKIYNESLTSLIGLKTLFINEFPYLQISIGDTPSMSVINRFKGVGEIRPGNFVFYDVMQCFLGSCKLNDIGVCLACPVVAKHENRSEIVIYGGAVHLSKESVEDTSGNRIFGLVAELTETGWDILDESNYVSYLSQEHGILKVNKDIFDKIKIGGVIGVIPVHSCLTANLASYYLTTDNQVIKKLYKAQITNLRQLL